MEMSYKIEKMKEQSPSKASARKMEKKSILEDYEAFRAWQETLFKARGKRIITV